MTKNPHCYKNILIKVLFNSMVKTCYKKKFNYMIIHDWIRQKKLTSKKILSRIKLKHKLKTYFIVPGSLICTCESNININIWLYQK